MSERASRVAVLLGAGASADAGLPLSGQLTNYLIEYIGSNLDLKLSAALNQICSAIIAHRGAQGVSPLVPLNVERVISSIRLLRAREEHEAAPFVASWLPALSNAGSAEVSASTARQITDQLGLGTGNPFPGHLERALTDAIHEVVDGNRTDQTFARLEEECIIAVADRLRRTSDVSYLAPLIALSQSQGGLDIATLNYDLCVEQVCDNFDEPLCRGLRDGWPVTPLSWSETGINLFKIHGSVDWWITDRGGWSEPDRDMGVSKITIADAQPHRAQPAMVLGDREKLESLPVTLALISDFQAALLRASRLVIVGYSFSDQHINNIIGNWLDQDESRSVTILSPYTFFIDRKMRSDFADRLLMLTYDGSKTDLPRVNGVAATASKGLERALREGPTPFADVRIRLEAKRRDGRLIVCLVNDTADPLNNLSASGAANDQSLVAAGSVSLREGTFGHSAIIVQSREQIPPGGRWEVEVDAPAGTDLSKSRVRVVAHLPVGYISRTLELAPWT